MSQPFDDLPYLDHYLRDILRPRVERAIQMVHRSLTESVWQHVVRLVAAEQPSGNDETPAMIRKILEERMGLRMEASLTTAFTALGDTPAGSARPAPDVVVRPAALPLVNAVLASSRRNPDK